MGYVPPWFYRWVLAAVVTLVIWLAWASTRTPEALWAPGHLSRYHAGVQSCMHCHEPFQGPTAARCVACHDVAGFRREAGSVADFHVGAVERQRRCVTCHTEHRGDTAPITIRPLHNPHGELVFLATGARSCADCHAFPDGLGGRPTLLDNALVRDLIEEGEGAHRRGGFARCADCHAGGRVESDD